MTLVAPTPTHSLSLAIAVPVGVELDGDVRDVAVWTVQPVRNVKRNVHAGLGSPPAVVARRVVIIGRVVARRVVSYPGYPATRATTIAQFADRQLAVDATDALAVISIADPKVPDAQTRVGTVRCDSAWSWPGHSVGSVLNSENNIQTQVA